MQSGPLVVQLVGVAIALCGVMSMAALPLPDYHWYNRLAVLVLMGGCACLVSLLALLLQPAANPDQFGRVALYFGLPLIPAFILGQHGTLSSFPSVRRSILASVIRLTPVGMTLQLVPPILGLVGVRVW